jgi:hypothetical protein
MEFNLSDLTEQQLAEMAFIVSSPAYQETVIPYFVARRENAIKLLLRGDASRKDAYTDDYLRGAISTVEALMDFFEIVAKEATPNGDNRREE